MPGIEYATRERTDEEVFELLAPEVASWFRGRFGAFTPPQRYAVAELHARRNVLISSPTGSGKTFSAFLAAVNELFLLAKRGRLEDRVYVLYVSPLKALGNDIRRNLEEPLAEIYASAESTDLPKIRVGVRTGDTSPRERAQQARKPPHILITTPETLAILLAAPKLGRALERVRWIVVDEIHALADNKRGAHLALSLERLCERVERAHDPRPPASAASGRAGRARRSVVRRMDRSRSGAATNGPRPAARVSAFRPVRIGLSATVAPLPDVAAFLVGRRPDGRPRDCLVVDTRVEKEIDVAVLCPSADLVNAPPEEASAALYRALDRLVQERRTTIVFTNTRGGTERVVQELKRRFGARYAEAVGAHHGSLSREERLGVEERLKRGELRCVVTSSSLELGIDVGAVDLVVLLGSPKGVSRALQRVGRAGHRLKDASVGRILVLDRDDLVECTVLARLARERALDTVRIPRTPLDVLAQHVLGMSLDRRWDLAEAHALVRGADPYRDLSEEDLREVLRYLAGAREELAEKRVYGKLWFDEEAGAFGRRGRMSRPIYYTNTGVIPDEAAAAVVTLGGRFVGRLEGEFAEQLKPGDVFALSGSTWAYRSATTGKVLVEPRPGASPTIPAWHSEQMPLSRELADAVGAFRRKLDERLDRDDPSQVAAWLAADHRLDPEAAREVVRYFVEQRAVAKVPSDRRLVVEECIDESGSGLGRVVYVFHCVIGRRANDALARAAGRVVAKYTGHTCSLTVSDNGFLLAYPRRVFRRAERGTLGDHVIEDILDPHSLRGELVAGLEGSEIVQRRFRHVAGRMLLVLRNYLGRGGPPGRAQRQAASLYKVVRGLGSNFPAMKELWREVLEEAMDLPRAQAFLERVAAREVEVVVLRNRDLPSPFAFHLAAAAGADASLFEERRAALRDLHARLARKLAADGAKG